MSEQTLPLRTVSWSHIGFTADNRLNAMAAGFLIKINRSKQIAVVGHGHSRHFEGLHLFEKRVQLVSAI